MEEHLSRASDDTATEAVPSPRRRELLEAAYRYVVANGVADLSSRPLAASTGTSPRVLLYLFGSKDGLVREILAWARGEQRALVRRAVTKSGAESVDLLWEWLSAPAQRDTIRLFVEAYARSLHPDPGPWEGFAQVSVEEWLGLLDEVEPSPGPERTLRLAVLRGLLLDLLATGDVDRVTAAYRLYRATAVARRS